MMQSEYEIKVLITENIGEIRRLDNKDELFGGCLSSEEFEVLDRLIAERDILRWVLS
jgi:hypothetical protein